MFLWLWNESLIIHEKDNSIISLNMMGIWLSDGPVAHYIFKYEYLKYWKGKITSKKKLVNISKEYGTSQFLLTLAPEY